MYFIICIQVFKCGLHLFFLLNNWNKLAWLPSNPHKLLYELNLIITICFHRRGKRGSDRWLSYPDRVAEWGGEGTGAQDPKSSLFHRIWCVFPFLLHLQCPPQKRVGGGRGKPRTLDVLVAREQGMCVKTAKRLQRIWGVCDFKSWSYGIIIEVTLPSKKLSS